MSLEREFEEVLRENAKLQEMAGRAGLFEVRVKGKVVKTFSKADHAEVSRALDYVAARAPDAEIIGVVA